MTFDQMRRSLEQFCAGERPATPIETRPDGIVVWSGGELLPDRPSQENENWKYLLDVEGTEPKRKQYPRKYTKTGNHTIAPFDGVIIPQETV